MLTIYRRHRKACRNVQAAVASDRGAPEAEVRQILRGGKGRGYRRCQCPIWVDGTLGGREIRQSLKTREWQKAQELVRQWEAEGQRCAQAPQSEPITIEQAREKFLADALARKLNESTIYKYRLLFQQLEGFAQRRGLRFLTELDVDILGMFRAEWRDGPRSSLKKLERLRALLRFAERRKWIDGNPALELKAPKVPVRPTLPFTREEMLRILSALEKYGQRAGAANAQRLRAFVLLLRYSGMRIGDAVACSTDRITGNKLFLYTQKTDVPVHCVLPDFVVSALEATPLRSSRYWFWSGESKLHTCVGIWQRRLQTLFRLAKVPGGHAHRFRDTFAVDLLLAGIPLERVSVLLGHQSVRITERHYAPWVRSRQEQLEADLQRVWSQDPVVLSETKGTREVHGNERIQ